MKGLFALLLLSCGIVMLLIELFLLPTVRPSGGPVFGVLGLILVIVAMVLDRGRLCRKRKE